MQPALQNGDIAASWSTIIFITAISNSKLQTNKSLFDIKISAVFRYKIFKKQFGAFGHAFAIGSPPGHTSNGLVTEEWH